MKTSTSTAGTTSHNINLNCCAVETLWEGVRTGLLPWLPYLPAHAVVAAWAICRELEAWMDSRPPVRGPEIEAHEGRLESLTTRLAASLGLVVREDPFLPGDGYWLVRAERPDGVGIRLEYDGWWTVDRVDTVFRAELTDRLLCTPPSDRFRFALRVARWSAAGRELVRELYPVCCSRGVS